MAVVIIHDFVPYVPPKPPATLPQPEETDIGKYLNVDSNVDLVYSSVENELPTPTAGDNGKFVGIDDAKYKILDVPTELPTVSSSDNGQILGVVNGAWDKTAAPSGLPSVTSYDNGKILTVNNGAWSKSDKLILEGGNVSDWSTDALSIQFESTGFNYFSNLTINVEHRKMSPPTRTNLAFKLAYVQNVNQTARFYCIDNVTDSGVYYRYFDVNANSTSTQTPTVTSVKLD